MDLWARRLWEVLEPYHAVVYFAPEVHDRYRQAGVKGFWMGYFASRAYPLGPASPELVSALFFNFHPAMVRRALPDAWRLSSVDAVAEARWAGVDAALRRILGDALGGRAVAEAAEIAADAVAECPLEGRPLFAAYMSLPWPEEPHLRLWHAATLLREHRGDGHVVANVAGRIDGIEAHVLMAATSPVPREVLQLNRGWSDEDWDAARARLVDRGWFDDDGITDDGRRARQRIEETTDTLAAAPWAAIGGNESERLFALVHPLAQRVIDAGGIPIPNPMGVPWPPGSDLSTAGVVIERAEESGAEERP